jgi:hypothetical protein
MNAIRAPRGGDMALDFTQLRQALQFTSKEKGAPNLTLDVRIEVRSITNLA